MVVSNAVVGTVAAAFVAGGCTCQDGNTARPLVTAGDTCQGWSAGTCTQRPISSDESDTGPSAGAGAGADDHVSTDEQLTAEEKCNNRLQRPAAVEKADERDGP